MAFRVNDYLFCEALTQCLTLGIYHKELRLFFAVLDTGKGKSMNSISKKSFFLFHLTVKLGGMRVKGQGDFCDKSCKGTGIYSCDDVINPFMTAEHS